MLAYTGLAGTSAVSHSGTCGNHLETVDHEAVDLRTVVGMVTILPNTEKELKHEVWVETSRWPNCNGVVNFA
jgi:hypothetical protein